MVAVQNSIDSYVDLLNDGTLGEKQSAVLQYIYRHPNCTYNEIARELRIRHTSVVARINELREGGYIKLSGNKVDEFTHKLNQTYRVRRTDEEPDDMLKDAQPKIPPAIRDFILNAVDGIDNGHLVEVTTSNNVRWVASIHGDSVELNYGDFMKMSGIINACEDIAQNRFVITGADFTLFFRIN